MRNSSSGSDDRGNLERLGESAGAMAGRAADFGMEVTGALFRSAAEMLGGWWSSDAPRQAAGAWDANAEQNCRSHFTASARGSTGGGTSGGMHASGSVGGVSGSVSTSGSSSGAGNTGNVAPKSGRAAMQSAGEVQSDTGGSGGAGFTGSAHIGDTTLSGSAHLDTSSSRGSSPGGSAGAAAGSSSGGASASGRASVGGASFEGAMSMDSATDGFERARPGYQFGYVARQNPAYAGRSFSEIEPELRKVWESRARTEGGANASTSSWPEVRGFVDFAYQQGSK